MAGLPVGSKLLNALEFDMLLESFLPATNGPMEN
jgi:hypothetical protein